MKPKKTYERAPEVPSELVERYEMVLRVLSGEETVSAAARRLELSRNHFQSMMHRGLAGLIEGLALRPAGRPPKPPEQAALEEENARLRRENQRLQERVETIDRVLDVASGLIQGRIRTSGRRTKTASSKPTTRSNDSDEEPHGAQVKSMIEKAKNLRSLGLRAMVVAALIGVGGATLRRWTNREKAGRAPVEKRGGARRPAPAPETEARVEHIVRETRGLIGAEALRHSVEGISRRQAAAIKEETLTAIERERQARATRITITQPGVVRGFDAMYVRAEGELRYPLVAGDASVPYRTSITVARRYDGPWVAAALERDIREHGAPLVYRLDRARCHRVDEVEELLRKHEVLVLHGPPHHPGYYGQLERQNREHRAWLARAEGLRPDALDDECALMMAALNASWRRRTLGWRTASEVWMTRPIIVEDRTALREEVVDRAARVQRELDRRGIKTDMAQRVAIEHALAKRGYLRREVGGWC